MGDPCFAICSPHSINSPGDIGEFLIHLEHLIETMLFIEIDRIAIHCESMEIGMFHDGTDNGCPCLEFLLFRMFHQMFLIITGIADVGMGFSEIMDQSGNAELEMFRWGKRGSFENS